jgi:hypothetical protein
VTAVAVLALVLGLGRTPVLAQKGETRGETQIEAQGPSVETLFNEGKYAEALAAAEELAKTVEENRRASRGGPGQNPHAHACRAECRDVVAFPAVASAGAKTAAFSPDGRLLALARADGAVDLRKAPLAVAGQPELNSSR